MRTLGKAGTGRTGEAGKVGDCGVTMVFLGYTDKHEGNCYQLFNPLRNSVMGTHNLT